MAAAAEALAVPILRDVTQGMAADEARWLVDLYYNMQDYRIQADGQVRSIAQQRDDGTFLVGEWLSDRFGAMEREVRNALGRYANEHVPGVWAQTITGIGPVIAAGLLAHIDIERAPTAGHIWRFAGQDPSLKWLGKAGAERLLGHVDGTAPSDEYQDDDAGDLAVLTDLEIMALEGLEEDQRGQLSREQLVLVSRLTNRKIGNLVRAGADSKGRITRASMLSLLAKRPWNARLKVLCWKIGDSFVKQKGRDSDIYGHVYTERKLLELERNEAGLFAEQAAQKLATKKIRDADLKRTLEAGRLALGHLDNRARRYAVKLFLAHLHHVMFEDRFGTAPPLPYIIEHGGHTHFIAPPNWPLD